MSKEKVQQLINDLSQLRRNHYIPASSQREDVVLHSYSVAMLSWYFYELTQPGLDLKKILQYAIVHDVPEVYAGDVNSYASKAMRRRKEIEEKRAIAKLHEEFLGEFDSLTEVINAYEAKSDEESWFVWSVDKIQAKVQGNLDIMRTYYEQGISKAEYIDYLQGIQGRIHISLRALYDNYMREWIDAYDDKMVIKGAQLITRNEAPRSSRA